MRKQLILSFGTEKEPQAILKHIRLNYDNNTYNNFKVLNNQLFLLYSNNLRVIGVLLQTFAHIHYKNYMVKVNIVEVKKYWEEIEEGDEIVDWKKLPIDYTLELKKPSSFLVSRNTLFGLKLNRKGIVECILKYFVEENNDMFGSIKKSRLSEIYNKKFSSRTLDLDDLIGAGFMSILENTDTLFINNLFYECMISPFFYVIKERELFTEEFYTLFPRDTQWGKEYISAQIPPDPISKFFDKITSQIFFNEYVAIKPKDTCHHYSEVVNIKIVDALLSDVSINNMVKTTYHSRKLTKS